MSAPDSSGSLNDDGRDRKRGLDASDDEDEDGAKDDYVKSSGPRRKPIDLSDGDDSAEDEEEGPIRRERPSAHKKETTLAKTPRNDDGNEDYSNFDDGYDDDDAPSSNLRKYKSLSKIVKREHLEDDSDADDDKISPVPTKKESRYGSDGEDDLSEEEDRRHLSKRPSSKDFGKRKSRSFSDDEDGDDGGVDNDEYSGKKRKKVKPEYDDEHGDGLMDEEEREKKPAKKKSQFETALEKAKAGRRSRGKELDPQTIENESVAFLERMMKARDDDLRSFKKGQPALEKIRMLRDVEMMMMKVQYREYLLDNLLLSVFRAWLDRLPDGTLPNVQVRSTLLKILLDLPMDEDWVDRLESSEGIGKVVHFLSRNEDHEPNKRIAEKIMMKWARPVYKMSSNFHNLLDEFDKPEEGHRAPKDSVAAERKAAMRTVRRLKTTEEKLKEFSGNSDKSRVMASMPRPAPFLFTTVAEGASVVDDKVRQEVRSNRAKTKKVNRTLSNLRRLNKRNMSRGTKPSINGR